MRAGQIVLLSDDTLSATSFFPAGYFDPIVKG